MDSTQTAEDAAYESLMQSADPETLADVRAFAAAHEETHRWVFDGDHADVIGLAKYGSLDADVVVWLRLSEAFGDFELSEAFDAWCVENA